MPTTTIMYPPPSTRVMRPNPDVQISAAPEPHEAPLPDGVQITPAPAKQDLTEEQVLRPAAGVVITLAPKPPEKKVLEDGSYWHPQLNRYVSPNDAGWNGEEAEKLYPPCKEEAEAEPPSVGMLLKSYTKEQLIKLSGEYGIKEAERMNKTQLAQSIVDAISNGDA